MNENQINDILATISSQAERIEELKRGLKECKEALDVWINLYAPEHCDPENVEWARNKIKEFGTLSYISKKIQIVRRLLERRNEKES